MSLEYMYKNPQEETQYKVTNQLQEEFERRNMRNYAIKKLALFLFDCLPDKGVHFQKLLPVFEQLQTLVPKFLSRENLQGF